MRVLRSLCAVLLALGLPVSAGAQDGSGEEAAAAPSGAAPEAADILGLWTTEPEEGEWARVEIYRCDDFYCGRIVWINEPTYAEAGPWGETGDPKIDWENDDEELRGRSIVGLELMHSFRFDDEKWKDGRIYDPQNGNTYDCEMTLTEDGSVLRVHGYVKIVFVKVGRTTNWTRYTG